MNYPDFTDFPSWPPATIMNLDDFPVWNTWIFMFSTGEWRNFDCFRLYFTDFYEFRWFLSQNGRNMMIFGQILMIFNFDLDGSHYRMITFWSIFDDFQFGWTIFWWNPWIPLICRVEWSKFHAFSWFFMIFDQIWMILGRNMRIFDRNMMVFDRNMMVFRRNMRIFDRNMMFFGRNRARHSI